jgi:CRP-like cAMP-binding protein
VGLFSQNVKVQALKRAPLFEGLSKKELAELARLTDDLEVEAGTVLCREGAIGQEFFAVVDGDVEVTKGGKPVRGREHLDFFGEIALVSNVKRTATVTARTPLQVFVMTRSAFRQALDHNPSMQRKVLEAMGERLAASGDHV